MTLGAYRVFGCYDSVGDDVLIAAYNMAYEDGSDIITASIGGDNGWSEEPWAVAVQRIVEAGVPCPVAAGNEGDYVGASHDHLNHPALGTHWLTVSGRACSSPARRPTARR